MKSVVKWAVLAAIVVSVFGGFSAKAASFGIGDWVTVTENSVNPATIVSIYVPSGVGAEMSGTYRVYAGINNLTINGTLALQGFCIDPFHWSANGPLDGYQVVALQDAPKLPGQISDLEADQIGTLWASHFASAQTSDLNAAALQVAIWRIVGNGIGSGTDIFAVIAPPAIDSLATQWLGESITSGAGANLLGLTHERNGQDYVVQRVPDGGATVVLLGMGMLGLAVAGRQLRFC